MTRKSQQTGLEDFNQLLQKIDSGTSQLANTHYRAYMLEVRGIKLGVAALNSAWHATGAPSDGDYGKLLVGRMQMDEVADALKDAHIRIALMHHPLSWLTPKDSRNTHRQLLVHFDGLFYGHNHEADAQVTSGTSSGYFSSNAGCLYQSRDYFNGYCDVALHPGTKRWVVNAREYIEARQEFDYAVRFAPGGVSEFVCSEDPSAANTPQLPSDDYVDASTASFNGRLLPALVSEVAPRDLKSIFVDPLLSRVSQRKLANEGKNGDSGLFVPLKDILQLKRNVIIIGSGDMGKTTLLQRICSMCLELSTELPPFGAYVDLSIVGTTQASILDAIISFGGGAYRKSEIISLLKSGRFCICFDNLSEDRSKQFCAVRDFCQAYVDCRYFWSITEDVQYSLSPTRISDIVNDSEVFYLHPFGRKETRLLTQKWFGESAEECAAKVDDVVSLLGRLNIPRSPFLISALLWIREKQTQFSPVNQAEILDALIDGVMEKLSETKDRSKIDSTIKRHYLAALAEHLHFSGEKRVSSLELERFTVSYFTDKGLPSSVAPFLRELKTKGILLEVGNEVAFMFEAIRAFFLSTRLHENQTLLAKALSREHFLEFREELDYYTGRHRDQAEVLRQAISIVSDFRSEAAIDRDLAAFDELRSAGSPITRQGAARLKSAAGSRPSVEERHALLDSVDEPTLRSGFVSTRPRSVDTDIGRYLEALRIGSSILRNSELVDDVALKELGYGALTDGWCQILISVMAAIHAGSDGDDYGDAARDPMLGLLAGLLPSDSPGMAKYLRNLVSPNVIFSLAVESIGTAKLQLVMERHAKAKDAKTIQRLFNVFLAIDLRLPHWIDQCEALLKACRKNRYVCELIFTKLFQIYLLGRLRGGEEDRIKGMLGETITHMVPISDSKEKVRTKGNFLRNLEKRRLARRL